MVDQLFTQKRDVGNAICQALTNEVVNKGLALASIPTIELQAAKFSVIKDPADGSECLSGIWLTDKGMQLGSIQFNGDDSFYAEFDVLQPHPRDKRWFVEAVTAWGTEAQIKTELRLLEAV
jgi:hypothetical protein